MGTPEWVWHTENTKQMVVITIKLIWLWSPCQEEVECILGKKSQISPSKVTRLMAPPPSKWLTSATGMVGGVLREPKPRLCFPTPFPLEVCPAREPL